MANEALWRALEDLRQRVARLETHLGEMPQAAKQAANHTERSAPAPSAVPPTAPPIINPPARPSGAADSSTVVPPPSRPTAAVPGTSSAPTPPTALPSSSAAARAEIHPSRATNRRPSPAVDRTPLEVLVGGKAMAWIGGLAVMLGAAFLIHYGYEQGWWTLLSPTVRCLLIAGFGGLLIAGGELALRKISGPASLGLFGAGLGVVYLDTFAAFQQFGLVSQGAAFLLMAAVAVGGFAITLRSNFRSIGILSMIGAYATPILLGAARGSELEVLIYLSAVLATALALSAFRPRAFRALRYLALGGQALLGFIWLVQYADTNWFMGVFFISAWWVMLTAECTLAAIRSQSRIGNVAAALIATAAYVTAAAWILNIYAPAGPNWMGENWHGIFTACLAVLSVVLAMQFGTGIAAFRSPVRSALDVFSIALWLQCGVLIATAIAMQFDGFGQTVGWLVLALVAIEMGSRLPSRGVAWFGLIVGMLAVAAMALQGLLTHAFGGSLAREIFTMDGVRIDRWTVLALLTMAAMVTGAMRLRRAQPAAWFTMPPLIMAATCLAWLMVTANQCDGPWQTGAWLLGAVMLLAFQRWGTRERFLDFSLLLLAASAGHWLLFDSIALRITHATTTLELMPALNAQFGMLIAIVAVGAWAARCMRQAVAVHSDIETPMSIRQHIAALIPTILIIFILLGLSFELERIISQLEQRPDWHSPWDAAQLRELCLIALWAVGGLAMTIIGRVRSTLPMFATGTAVLVITGFIWLTFGTIMDRVMHGTADSMIVLNAQALAGLLIIVTAALALRFASRLPHRSDGQAALQQMHHALLVFIGVIPLWIGSLEIDRALSEWPVAVQAGLSVYWAIYGVALIVIGFARHIALVRHLGLTLLFLTIGKVFLIDLSGIDSLWYILSAIGTGLVFIGTSIIYARLSSQLIDETKKPAHS